MSLFNKLFGQRPTKIDLIRTLLKSRLRSDSMAQLAEVSPDIVDAQPDAAIIGTPEGTIATIVETYTTMRRQGVPDAQILEFIEEHRSMIGADTMPSPLTLRSYIRYRVSFEYSASAPVSDDSIDYSIQEARKFFESV
jgi:hypothetical protein